MMMQLWHRIPFAKKLWLSSTSMSYTTASLRILSTTATESQEVSKVMPCESSRGMTRKGTPDSMPHCSSANCRCGEHGLGCLASCIPHRSCCPSHGSLVSFDGTPSQSAVVPLKVSHRASTWDCFPPTFFWSDLCPHILFRSRSGKSKPRLPSSVHLQRIGHCIARKRHPETGVFCSWFWLPVAAKNTSCT